MPETRPFTYRMDDELRKRLEAFGRRTHRNLTQSITHLVLDALDREEGAQKTQIVHPGSAHAAGSVGAVEVDQS